MVGSAQPLAFVSDLDIVLAIALLPSRLSPARRRGAAHLPTHYPSRVRCAARGFSPIPRRALPLVEARRAEGRHSPWRPFCLGVSKRGPLNEDDRSEHGGHSPGPSFALECRTSGSWRYPYTLAQPVTTVRRHLLTRRSKNALAPC